MSRLQLARVPTAAPIAADGSGGRALQVVLAALDSTGRILAACTSNGELGLLLVDQEQRQAGMHAHDAFAVVLLKEGRPPEQLAQPWSVLCWLPGTEGFLFAQAGSGKLLFCQHPSNLEPGQAADVFLFGTHPAPIGGLALSPCGSQVLSTDASGGLKLWSLQDGSQLAETALDLDVNAGAADMAAPACCFLADTLAATAVLGASLVSVWNTSGGSLQLVAELDIASGGGGGGGGQPSQGGQPPSSRQVSALAASGQLLAVGCSDGSTLLWRHSSSMSGAAEFVQQALIASPSCHTGDLQAVPALSFGPHVGQPGTLLAVALGSVVTVSACTPVGSKLMQAGVHHMLPAPAVALVWGTAGSPGELLAVLQGGSTCSLSTLSSQQQQQQPGVSAGTHPATEPQAAGPGGRVLHTSRKKSVRFAGVAEDCSGGMAGAAVELGAAAWPPSPGLQDPCYRTEPLAAAGVPDQNIQCWQRVPGAVGSGVLGRGNLPALPSHPLLQVRSSQGTATISGANGPSLNSAGSDDLFSRSPMHAASIKGSGSNALQGPCLHGRAVSVGNSAMPPASGRQGSVLLCQVEQQAQAQRQPLYPILDLRALQGLPPAQQQAPAAAVVPAAVPGAAVAVQLAVPAQPAVCPAAASTAARPPPQPLLVAPSPPRSPPRQLRVRGSVAGPRLVAVPAEITATRSVSHAATSTEPAGPDMRCWQWEQQSTPAVAAGCSSGVGMGAHPSSASEHLQPPGQQQDGPTAHQQEEEAGEEAPRQRQRLPSPVKRSTAGPRPVPPQQLPGARISKQQCEACRLLATAQPCSACSCKNSMAEASSRSGGATSPAKAAMLADLAALQAEQQADPEAGISRPMPSDTEFAAAASPGCNATANSRPRSPLKLGVACLQGQQQEGELQPAEVYPFTVEEVDARHALTATRQQRYALLSRRCTFAKQQQQQQAVQEAGGAACMQQAHASSCEHLPSRKRSESLQQESPASGVAGSACAGLTAALGKYYGPELAEQPSGAVSKVEAPTATQLSVACHNGDGIIVPAIQSAGMPAAEAAALAAYLLPEAAQGMADVGAGADVGACPVAGYAVGSDTELSDGEEVGWGHGGISNWERSAAGNLPAAAAAAPPAVAQEPGVAAVPAGLPSQLSGGGVCPPARHAAQGQAMATKLVQSAGSAESDSPTLVSGPYLAAGIPVHQPCSSLAAPSANSSLLLLHRRRLLEQQVATAAKSTLPQHELDAARRQAATAATTLPPAARLYSDLPPLPPSPSATGKAGAETRSPQKVLDGRWVEEQARLRPKLDDLWVPPVERVQMCTHLLPPPQLAPPVLSGKRLMAGFLGLRV